MSENFEKLRGIERLPVFPLPLVMMPNEVLPLHIFEPKYRQMLADVQDGNKMFGVVNFEPDPTSTADRPLAGTIGCVAELREVETLDDGRSNIITYGLARFRLLEYLMSDEPYLMAEIEFFEDDPSDPAEIDELAEKVFLLFERIAKAAFTLSGGRGRLPEIQRTDPQTLSFLIAAAFSFDDRRKYEFLVSTSTAERLSELKKVLDKAVDQMESNAEVTSVAKTNGHGKKKLDI